MVNRLRYRILTMAPCVWRSKAVQAQQVQLFLRLPPFEQQRVRLRAGGAGLLSGLEAKVGEEVHSAGVADKKQAKTIGNHVAKRMAREWGGQNLYIPGGVRWVGPSGLQRGRARLSGNVFMTRSMVC